LPLGQVDRPDTFAEVRTEVIVLNGGSSSGKSSLARCLQALLGPTWLTLGIDDLIRALPGGDMPFGEKPSIDFGPDGSVTVNDDFRRAEASWYRGLAAIALCGTGLIVDEVFLDGRASQERLTRTLSDSTVLWVGVRCDAEVAEARERERHDRVVGMARRQADQVHDGVVYSLTVDTTATSAMECARTITRHLADAGAGAGAGADR
jgi:chloramphenicol 3-O phosphotransferase